MKGRLSIEAAQLEGAAAALVVSVLGATVTETAIPQLTNDFGVI